MKPNPSEAGKRIKQLRLSCGFTMEELGRKIDNSPRATISNWERGTNLPNPQKLKLLSTITNSTIDWIKWGTLEEYITSYLIDIGYELYIKDFPEIPHKVFKDIQERYSNTFSLNKDYELLNPIIKNIFTKYYSKDFEDYRDIEVKPDPKKVGRKIRSIRKKLGLTMQEFGYEVSNSPRSTVSTWEHGGNLPNKAKLKKIADIANCSVEDLLFDEGFISKQSKVKLINELKEENSKLKEKIKYYECLFDGIESLLNSRKNS
ncbi:TPA: helix-turn-helix domain-containing protein [Enterococcus faecium]|nr:helix-turn-helix domain-containing protein [Enterococcus faecium]HCI0920927.1 helix-turn-helix domain-containing protein [Enterococcus faecium]HCI0944276.1 helix-turn-helix domain-containing protein [Enterococcus faecium]HCI0948490.1 helix-turn-helix domain-containing protein [Enterococcus faecium]HCI0962158.1 helix-turn-helix domain-containing protein [Enterococcus faecium]